MTFGRALALAAHELGFHLVAHQFATLLFAKLERVVDGLITLPLGSSLALLIDADLLILLLRTQRVDFVAQSIKALAPHTFLRGVGLLRRTFLLKALDLLLKLTV